MCGDVLGISSLHMTTRIYCMYVCICTYDLHIMHACMWYVRACVCIRYLLFLCVYVSICTYETLPCYVTYMCICIHTYPHTSYQRRIPWCFQQQSYMYKYMLSTTNICTSTCLHTWMHAYIHACMPTYIHTCMHGCCGRHHRCTFSDIFYMFFQVILARHCGLNVCACSIVVNYAAGNIKFSNVSAIVILRMKYTRAYFWEFYFAYSMFHITHFDNIFILHVHF